MTIKALNAPGKPNRRAAPLQGLKKEINQQANSSKETLNFLAPATVGNIKPLGFIAVGPVIQPMRRSV